MPRPLTLFLVLLTVAVSRAEDLHYTARDTLRLPENATAATRDLHEAAGYEAGEFQVTVAPPAEGEAKADMVVRFPSPRPDAAGDDRVNTVILEWYTARKEGNPVRRAPAVLILHTLDRRLHVSQGIARVLASEGVHAFVMHSAGYGMREYDRYTAWGERFFERAAQAIADARRARDAIAALPAVEMGRVSVQGTSLGGFQALGAASLDGVFDHNFIYLAGADLHGVFTHGQREAEWVRKSILRHGVTEAQLPELCRPLDPVHTAHVLDPARTWLFSAKDDQVIPADNARLLAKTLGLTEEHHTWLGGDHYIALMHFEWVARQMAKEIKVQ